MKWHEEVLDRAARKAAERLAGVLPAGFYLAGGTGLALRLGHRVSLDLDLFSRENILSSGERTQLVRMLKASGPVEIVEEKDGTCHLRLGSTRVSLFHYPYLLLDPPDNWRGLDVAHFRDIAAMKLSAVIGRGLKKDFVDLYALSRHLDPEAWLEAGRRKFSDHPDFDLQAARALVFFEDAEKEPLPCLKQPVSWPEIKSYFERTIPAIVRRELRKKQ